MKEPRSQTGTDHGDADLTRIRRLAVTTDDLLAALEARFEDGRPTVFRVTPPFAGRMRAHLHVSGAEGEYGDYSGSDDALPIHFDPRIFLNDDAHAYPAVDETEVPRENEPPFHDTDHERDAAAVATWRDTVSDHLVDEVSLDTTVGPHRVAVRYLG